MSVPPNDLAPTASVANAASGNHETAPAAEVIVSVPARDLREAPWQPRRSPAPADAGEEVRALARLARDIHDVGVLEPVLVRPHPDGSGFELLAGHRRRAAVLLLEAGAVADRDDDAGEGAGPALGLPPSLRDSATGAALVPARVLRVDDLAARRITLAENAQRQDLCAWDRALAVEAFREAAGRTGAGALLAQQDVAHELRMPSSTVSECLRIAGALTPDVQNAAVAGWPATHADDDVLHALRRLSHAVLYRAAGAGDGARRAEILGVALERVPRKRVGRGGAAKAAVGTASTDAAYERLRAGDPFDFRCTRGIAHFPPSEADAQLRRLAPAVGVLAGLAKDGGPVVLDTGSGGQLIVLPGDPESMDARALADALAEVGDVKRRLENVRAARADAGATATDNGAKTVGDDDAGRAEPTTRSSAATDVAAVPRVDRPRSSRRSAASLGVTGPARADEATALDSGNAPPADEPRRASAEILSPVVGASRTELEAAAADDAQLGFVL